MSPEDVARFIKEKNAQVVDLKFNDLPGLWQHFSMPVSELTEMDDLTKSIWVESVGFDGSSIRGFQKIQESDMILIPDPATARIDPVCAAPTLSIICDIYDPLTRLWGANIPSVSGRAASGKPGPPNAGRGAQTLCLETRWSTTQGVKKAGHFARLHM